MKKTKKLLAVVLALILALSVAAVGTGSLSAGAAVDEGKDIGVGLTDTMYVGDSQTYSITPFYSNIASAVVTSSNPDVVAAYSNGRGGANVYAKKQGVAKVTITLMTFDNNNTNKQSASVTVTVLGSLAAPTNVKIQNKGTGFYITWNKVAGAARYIVYFKRSTSSNWSTESTTTNSYHLTSLYRTLYNIQIRAVDSQGHGGAYSKAASFTHVRGTTLYSTVYNSNGSVTISWDYADGANGYAVAKKKAGDKNYTYYYTTATSYNDKKVVGGTVYYYQIRPYYSNGKSAAYAEWSNAKSITTLFKPTITNMNINSSRLNINWNKIGGVKSYKVAFKRATDSAWNYRTVTTNYYNITKPTANAVYYVQVCPLNGSVAGPWSAVKSISLASLGKPSLSGYNNGYRNILNWNSISGATSYQIAKKSTTDSSYKYYTTTSTSYSDYDYVDGKTYTYQVRAYNGSTYGPWSNVSSITKKVNLTKPVITDFFEWYGRLQLEWIEISGVSEYKVAYKTENENNWHYAYVYDTGEFDLYSYYSNTRYYFQVSAIGPNGECEFSERIGKVVKSR